LDVEGVSKIYPENEIKFFHSFDALLNALRIIGTNVYPKTPDRLFAHQIGGDGLLIVSEFAEGKPGVPISVAVVLMQVLMMNGAVAKGGISEGGFADVSSCFPSLRSFFHGNNKSIPLGNGLLTIFPVMGTALINAHRFAARPPRGSRLAVDVALAENLPKGIVISKREHDFIVIDWIHTRTQTMEMIAEKSGLKLLLPNELKSKLTAYVLSTGELGKSEWGQNSLALNGCEPLRS